MILNREKREARHINRSTMGQQKTIMNKTIKYKKYIAIQLPYYLSSFHVIPNTLKMNKNSSPVRQQIFQCYFLGTNRCSKCLVCIIHCNGLPNARQCKHSLIKRTFMIDQILINIFKVSMCIILFNFPLETLIDITLLIKLPTKCLQCMKL